MYYYLNVYTVSCGMIKKYISLYLATRCCFAAALKQFGFKKQNYILSQFLIIYFININL